MNREKNQSDKKFEEIGKKRIRPSFDEESSDPANASIHLNIINQ